MKINIENILPSGKTHSATIFFFHGSGDTGHNLIEWIRFLLGKDMQFPHIKIVFPTAPLQSYTPLNGQQSNVWFDRKSVSIEALECRQSLASIYKMVNELIRNEVNIGIPINRIMVGGFSMGGALAMHTGYHIETNLAGVFACSSFLNSRSIVYDSLANRKQTDNGHLPELLMFHGDRDTLVPENWGHKTFVELQKFGIAGKFVPVKNTFHELKNCELLELQEWIVNKLPPLENDLQNKL